MIELLFTIYKLQEIYGLENIQKLREDQYFGPYMKKIPFEKEDTFYNNIIEKDKDYNSFGDTNRQQPTSKTQQSRSVEPPKQRRKPNKTTWTGPNAPLLERIDKLIQRGNITDILKITEDEENAQKLTPQDIANIIRSKTIDTETASQKVIRNIYNGLRAFLQNPIIRKKLDRESLEMIIKFVGTHPYTLSMHSGKLKKNASDDNIIKLLFTIYKLQEIYGLENIQKLCNHPHLGSYMKNILFVEEDEEDAYNNEEYIYNEEDEDIILNDFYIDDDSDKV
jgi:hypothetical protein